MMNTFGAPYQSVGATDSSTTIPTLSEFIPVELSVAGDAKKLFNEGRALELQGNIPAAQRLYSKVTKLVPRFVYGWSNLGNTQTALGELDKAEISYTTAVNLCQELIRTTTTTTTTTTNSLLDSSQNGGKARSCPDLYVILLNRGSLRLNTGQIVEALKDLQQATLERGRPDAVVLQNLARAEELNGYYSQADRDYTVAISMTANEVNPFWLRSAMVKLQLGDISGGYALLKRVENRFPEAPEVRAASAVFLWARGETTSAQQKFLQIPDRQRLRYVDTTYLTKTIAWPPTMLELLAKITRAVGDGAA